MELSDLPIDLLLRILPIEDHLLDLPNKIIIPWLNLLPQRRSFRMLGNSGVCCETYPPSFITWDGYYSYKYGKDSKTIKESVAKVTKKFENNIYVKDGTSVDAKYYKKFIIFDFAAVIDLCLKRKCPWSCFQVWTGNEDERVNLWTHYFAVDGDSNDEVGKSCHVGLHASAKMTAELNQKLKNSESDISWKIDIYPSLFKNVDKVELAMSFDDFMEMKQNITNTKDHLAPRDLRIRFRSVGVKVKKKDHPADFLIEWVTDLFGLDKVQNFTLHYFIPQSTCKNLKRLLRQMPKLLQLDLSFGKLDFEKVVWMLPFKTVDCHIQVRVDEDYFESKKFTNASGLWNVDVQDTSVIVGCVRKPIADNTVVYKLSLAKSIRVWLNYRRWKRKQRKLERLNRKCDENIE
ncbi:hypothetical protein I9W82_005435 [Candida metapsilosis]|uniref:Uncharacterized protein n=1 Tax=Candida metapsilosis TaxID=273372 RepID=A0A8H8D9L2_9ASCO|nr:hypothetical protein I9W82_005435 [Candida metapsilosis]